MIKILFYILSLLSRAFFAFLADFFIYKDYSKYKYLSNQRFKIYNITHKKIHHD